MAQARFMPGCMDMACSMCASQWASRKLCRVGRVGWRHPEGRRWCGEQEYDAAVLLEGAEGLALDLDVAPATAMCFIESK
eukprot:3740479-Heterocapsa_arctica.AAC.1